MERVSGVLSILYASLPVYRPRAGILDCRIGSSGCFRYERSRVSEKLCAVGIKRATDQDPQRDDAGLSHHAQRVVAGQGHPCSFSATNDSLPSDIRCCRKGLGGCKKGRRSVLHGSEHPAPKSAEKTYQAPHRWLAGFKHHVQRPLLLSPVLGRDSSAIQTRLPRGEWERKAEGAGWACADAARHH